MKKEPIVNIKLQCDLFVFEGISEIASNKDGKQPYDMPCIIGILCKRHEGMEVEAMTIKIHWWNMFVKKLFDKKVSFCINIDGAGYTCALTSFLMLLFIQLLYFVLYSSTFY